MSKNQDIAQRRRQRKRLRKAQRLTARQYWALIDNWQPPERPLYYPSANELRQVGQELMPSLCAREPIFDQINEGDLLLGSHKAFGPLIPLS